MPESEAIPVGRLAFFCLQFFVILLVAWHDLLSIFASSKTILPGSLRPFWSRAAEVISVPLGQRLSENDPLRQLLSAYLNVTGIEAGYSYFAPTVPDNYKLVFEFRYRDGHTEFELPQVSGRATGLRLSTLLDVIAETDYEPLRAMLVKMLAYAAWQEHADAVKVRAVFGYVDLPAPAEFQRGQTESYQFLFAYDFDFASGQAPRR